MLHTGQNIITFTLLEQYLQSTNQNSAEEAQNIWHEENSHFVWNYEEAP